MTLTDEVKDLYNFKYIMCEICLILPMPLPWKDALNMADRILHSNLWHGSFWAWSLEDKRQTLCNFSSTISPYCIV